MRRWHTASVTRETKYGGTALILAGIVVLAINLRPAAISVGPVLSEIQSGLQMSAGTAGLLTTLPVVAFAVFGALAPRLAHSLGLHRTAIAEPTGLSPANTSTATEMAAITALDKGESGRLFTHPRDLN